MRQSKRRRGGPALLGLAFRNLSRHRVKTVITVSAVALGIAAYLYMDGFLGGVNTESRRNLVNYEMGAATIFSRAYWDDIDELPLYEGFRDYQGLLARLAAEGYDAAPRATFVGTLLSPEEELPFVFTGMDPEAERRLFRYHNFIDTDNGGHLPRDGVFEIMLGVKGAKDLNVRTRDLVRLSTVIDKRDEDGVLRHINQAIDLVVAGVVNSPDPMVNGNVGYLPLSVLQDELGLLLEGTITEIVVRKAGAREDQLPGASESPQAITRALGPPLGEELVVVGWQDRARDYLAASTGDVVQAVVFMVFFFVIVLLVISNTVLMAVLERTREIGMLRALGMGDGSIVRLSCIETGFIGLLGALIGLALFIPLNLYLVNHGIDYSRQLEDTGITNIGYRVVGIYKSTWNFHTIGLAVLAASLLASVTAVFPARRAVRLAIADTLRME
jgi:ABC-type lipoprotein release transport system permease subunit